MFSPLFDMVASFIKKDPRSFIVTDGSVSLAELKEWFGSTINLVEFIPPEQISSSRSYLSTLTEDDLKELAFGGEAKVYFFNEADTNGFVSAAIHQHAATVIHFSRFIDEEEKGFAYLNATFSKNRGYTAKGKVTLQLPLGYENDAV